MRIRLERVQYMPHELESGVLYIAEEFGAVAHLCACGCGTKVNTPLGPAEWSMEETPEGPSLYPSIGNWQTPCKSHYWIIRGEVRWARRWTAEEILVARDAEENRRRRYYDHRRWEQAAPLLRRMWMWLRKQLGR